MVEAFLKLLVSPVASGAFNPWRQRDDSTDLELNAPQQRIQRLKIHLSANIRYVLIGEAAGYQGCKVSGIPFTSERLIMEGQIPRVAVPRERLSTRARPWSEPSATTVWKTLHALGTAAETALWNAYPWHPHKPGNLHSNRPPSRTERQAGVSVLRSLLDLFPRAQVFAVGRNAETSLTELGIRAIALRHPSMGGATEFARQLRLAVAGTSAR